MKTFLRFGIATFVMIASAFSLRAQTGPAHCSGGQCTKQHSATSLRAIGWRLVLNQHFRDSIEATLASTDAQRLELAVQDIYARHDSLKADWQAIHAAHLAQDTTGVHVGVDAIHSQFAGLRVDRDTIKAILLRNRDKLVPQAVLTAPNLVVNPIIPNPVHSGESATLTYTLAKNADLTILVTNDHGEQVQLLASGPVTSGPHSIALNTGTLKPGVYFVRLTSATQTVTEKLIVD